MKGFLFPHNTKHQIVPPLSATLTVVRQYNLSIHFLFLRAFVSLQCLCVINHPPDAAMQAFWQIHGSDAIERRLPARDWQPMQYAESEDATKELSENGRRYLLSTPWLRVCDVLDSTLSTLNLQCAHC